MRLLKQDETVTLIVSRVRVCSVELVDVATGEMMTVATAEYEDIVRQSQVEEYAPFVTPKELRFEQRQDGWVERLREERLKAVSHMVKKARKKKSGGTGKPRKKRQMPKPPAAILEKIMMMPVEQRPALAASMGFSL